MDDFGVHWKFELTPYRIKLWFREEVRNRWGLQSGYMTFICQKNEQLFSIC